MQKFKKYITEHYVGMALLIIIAMAIFVRTYKFDEYLYFKMDQARDAILLTKAVESGPGYLPLLGARAGAVKLAHGFLRLGPIDYYFQYASGIIFHSTEAYVYAYPDLMFSILAIPMLFLLLGLYFSKRNALLITAMYAFAFIIIQYSRFAWNPNGLQFFLLLSFYGLLKFLNEKVEKRKKWWLILWSLGMTIGSQLHFFGFFSLVGISGLLIIFHYQLWKMENLKAGFQKEIIKLIGKYAAIVFLVFAFFYTPVAISDYYRGGENTHNFFEALGSKPANKPFLQKISKTFTENAKYYCLVTTSQCYGSDMKKEYPAIGLTALILFSGLFLVIRNLRKKTLTQGQRDFLALLIVWVAVFTILTVPVAFQLRPRFYIVVFAVPFIFMGLIFEYLEEKMKFKQAVIVSIALTAGIIGLNTHGTWAWFKEQAASQKKNVTVKRTLILKAKDGVTLGQLQGVTDWMYAKHKDGAALYYYIKPEHVRPIDFLISQKHDKKLKFSQVKMDGNPNAQYFAILNTGSDTQQIKDKFNQDYVILDSAQFGQITVYAIDFPNRVVDQSFKWKVKGSAEDRIFWKDVFSNEIKGSKK
jgi:hypothetical protein